MLGCAQCYQAFRKPLEGLLMRVHGNTQHAGRIPGGVKSDVSIRMNIDRLRQDLVKAIAAEEYEEAARLRDQIRALKQQLEPSEKADSAQSAAGEGETGQWLTLCRRPSRTSSSPAACGWRETIRICPFPRN